jgi:hypothetical protein
MEPQFSKMEPGLHFRVRRSPFTVRGPRFTVKRCSKEVDGTLSGPDRQGFFGRMANRELRTVNCQPLLLRLQTMVPEEIHEFLVVVRLDIEENAHPAIAASGCQ